MASGENGKGPRSQLVIRLLIPDAPVADVTDLHTMLTDVIAGYEGATLEISLRPPRPVRPTTE